MSTRGIDTVRKIAMYTTTSMFFEGIPDENLSYLYNVVSNGFGVGSAKSSFYGNLGLTII